MPLNSIKAKKIKKILLKHGFDNPTENSLLIGKTAIAIGLHLKDTDILIDKDIIEVYGLLDRLMDINIELMDELTIDKRNI